MCGSASTSRASASCCVCAGVSGAPPAPTIVSRPSGSASAHSVASTASSASSSSSSDEPARASRRFSASVPTKTCCSWVTSATSWRSVSSSRSTSCTPPTSTRAGPRRVDAREQPAERRLACAGGADDRDALARLEVELDPVQHVAPGDVRVAHVVRPEPVVVRLLARRRRGRAARPRSRRGARTRRRRPGPRRATRAAGRPGRRAAGCRGRPSSPRRPTHVRRRRASRPSERRDDGQDVGDVDGREPDRAEPQREALGGVGVREVGVDPTRALVGEPERLDGAAAVDRLPDRARERGVRGALPEIAARRVAQVPARPDRRGSARRRGRAARRSGSPRRPRPTTSSAVTHAIDVSGIANRIVRASASTSAVVRETRSPIPARSTVESGSARTRRMKSSRSSANICSERTNEERRAKKVRIVCATRKTGEDDHDAVDLGRVDARLQPWTSEPRSGGPTSPVAAASACRTTTPTIVRAVAAREHERLLRASRPCPRSGGSCSCRLPAGDDVPVRRVARRSSRCFPGRLDAPVHDEHDGSAWSSTSGLVVTTTVVTPARKRCSWRAMRASVWASTALVGSTSTRISASARSARARTSRCRWPPENERPRSSTSRRGPSGARSARPPRRRTSIAAEISSSVARAQGSSSLRSVPEKISGSGSLTRIRRRTTSSGRRSSGDVAEQDAGVVDQPPEPVGERARLVRRGGDEAGHAARRDGEARRGSASGTPAGGSATRSVGLARPCARPRAPAASAGRRPARA